MTLIPSTVLDNYCKARSTPQPPLPYHACFLQPPLNKYKKKKGKKKKPATWGLAPDHARQIAAPFWVNRSVSAVQDGHLENQPHHPSRWSREPWDTATPQSITVAFLLTLTSLNYPREHDSSPCLLFLFFWVSDMTFRCFGDNYRKREIELLAFFVPAEAV